VGDNRLIKNILSMVIGYGLFGVIFWLISRTDNLPNNADIIGLICIGCLIVGIFGTVYLVKKLINNRKHKLESK